MAFYTIHVIIIILLAIVYGKQVNRTIELDTDKLERSYLNSINMINQGRLYEISYIEIIRTTVNVHEWNVFVLEFEQELANVTELLQNHQDMMTSLKLGMPQRLYKANDGSPSELIPIGKFTFPVCLISCNNEYSTYSLPSLSDVYERFNTSLWINIHTSKVSHDRSDRFGYLNGKVQKNFETFKTNFWIEIRSRKFSYNPQALANFINKKTVGSGFYTFLPKSIVFK